MADNTDRDLYRLSEAIRMYKIECGLETSSSFDSPTPPPLATFQLEENAVYVWKNHGKNGCQINNVIHVNDFEHKNLAELAKIPKHTSCNFCKKNKEPASFYLGHRLKDDQGKVLCPVLRAHHCELCKATGDFAHTKQYCVLNSNRKSLTKTPTKTMSNGKPRKFF